MSLGGAECVVYQVKVTDVIALVDMGRMKLESALKFVTALYARKPLNVLREYLAPFVFTSDTVRPIHVAITPIARVRKRPIS